MQVVRAALLAALVAVPAAAQTSAVSYTYDDLGRLKTAVYPGGGSITYSYDANGNRTSVVAVASTSSPPPPPPPPPGNSPPVAANDIYHRTMPGSIWSGLLSVLSNDTDPDLPGDTLTIVSVTGSPYASVASGNVQILFSGPDGNYVLTYTIKDAANATSSATVFLYVASLE